MKRKKLRSRILALLLGVLVFFAVLAPALALGPRSQGGPGDQMGQRGQRGQRDQQGQRGQPDQRGQRSQPASPVQYPNIPEGQRPFGGIPWIVGIVLTLAVVGVGLKNSKRTHLD